MKRFPHSVCLALAVLALLALGRSAPAEERPFQLQRGHINPSVVEDTFASVDVFGEITHLGRTQGGGLVVLSPTGTYTFDVIGTIVFIAANGDRLYATFVGSGFLDDFLRIAGLEGTLTFVGGTGRFADASGSADLMFLSGVGSSIEGTIDY